MAIHRSRTEQFQDLSPMLPHIEAGGQDNPFIVCMALVTAADNSLSVIHD